MKVLHIEMGNHLYGGARQVVYLMEGLKHEGVENYLLAPKGSSISIEASDKCSKVITCNYRGDVDVRLALFVKKAVLKYSIDLVHIHSRRGADVWGGIGAKWAKVPAVLSRRVDNAEGPKSIKYKYPLFAKVIAISEGIKTILVQNGLPAQRVACVRSAFVAEDSQHPIDRQSFLARFQLPENSLVLAAVAQLIPRKGHKLLVECLPTLLEKHPSIQVLFFGEGAERNNIEQQITSAGLSDRIQLAGFQSDLNHLIGNVDLLVHPAYTEGLGVSLIQASAASVAIIASDAGGMPEIVRSGENGLLVPPGNKEALIDAIERLVSDQNLRQKMGARGKYIAEQEFSVPVMVDGNLAVYRKVLGNSDETEG